MKHLKYFEKFEEEDIPTAEYQLETNQIDDLNEEFEKFMDELQRDGKKITEKEVLSIFLSDKSGEITDKFRDFLNQLEENTDWFDYRMMDKIKNDLSIIIGKSFYEDDEDDDFAENDPDWPYEIEDSDTLEDEFEEEDDIQNLRNKSVSKMSIDDILDKINRSGYDSLTREERDFLDRSEKKRYRGR